MRTPITRHTACVARARRPGVGQSMFKLLADGRQGVARVRGVITRALTQQSRRRRRARDNMRVPQLLPYDTPTAGVPAPQTFILARDCKNSIDSALPTAATPEENEILAQIRKHLSVYAQNQMMISAGLYTQGTDPEIDLALTLN